MTALVPDAVKGRMLKIRTGELVGRAGGLEAAASFCRVSKSTIARYCSTTIADAECFAPIDVVRDLEKLVGDPIVTRFLAGEAHHVMVAKPRLASVCVAGLHWAIASCAREQGEATAHTLTSLAGTRIDAAHVPETLKQIDEAIEAQLTLRALVAQLAEEL